VGYLSAGFAFNVLSVNNLVYRNSTACQVAAAGSILVSIIIVSDKTFKLIEGIYSVARLGRLDILFWVRTAGNHPK
jgi:hypothetical protein